MNKAVSFDAIADTYDDMFTHSLIGNAQRSIVRKNLRSFLKERPPLQILEINCGTGEDAIWLSALGHKVLATDASSSMIQQAQRKIKPSLEPAVIFRQSEFATLNLKSDSQKYDLVFSNFAGLNCLSSEGLKKLSADLHSILNPGGYFIAVIFGKYTAWETFYYLLKFQFSKAIRRWTTRARKVELKEGVEQDVYYYTPRQFSSHFKEFELLTSRPVGFFLPPTYLEGMIKKRPNFFRWMIKMDFKTHGYAGLSAFADHTYLLLKKKDP